MTEKQQLAKLKRQIKEILKNLEPQIMRKAERALKSSAVPSEYKAGIEKDSYLLAKAVLDSIMRERPFMALSSDTRKEFDNIHICL